AFTVTTTAQITDLAGNTLSNSGSFTFTTGVAADTTRPTITGVNPTNGSTGIGTNAEMQIQFSERVNPLTVSDSTFQVQQLNTGILVAGTVVVAADRRSATFTPVGGLANSTQYRIQAFSITDPAGQDIGFFQSTFTTALGFDTTPPTVVAISPA